MADNTCILIAVVGKINLYHLSYLIHLKIYLYMYIYAEIYSITWYISAPPKE